MGKNSFTQNQKGKVMNTRTKRLKREKRERGNCSCQRDDDAKTMKICSDCKKSFPDYFSDNFELRAAQYGYQIL